MSKTPKKKLTNLQQRRYFLHEAHKVRDDTSQKIAKQLKVKEYDLGNEDDANEVLKIIERLKTGELIPVQEYAEWSDSEDEYNFIIVHKDDLEKAQKNTQSYLRKFKFMKSAREEISRLEAILVFTPGEEAGKMLEDFKTYCKTWLG